MKNTIKAITAIAISVFAVGCTEKDSIPADARLTISAQQIILEEDKGGDMALEIQWDDFAPGSGYTVMIANLYSVGWDNVWQKTTDGTSLSLTVAELEEALISIGREAGSDAYIKIKVQAGTDGGNGSTIVGSAVVRLYIPSINLNIPVITPSTTSAILSEATKMETALELSWTDAGLEDEKVSYYELEFCDASDTGFENPVLTEQVSGNTVRFNQLDFNIMLLKAGYDLGETASLIYRISAVPENDKVKGSISETHELSLTSYKRPVPEPGSVTEIYIAGSGVESQWSIPSDAGRFEDKGDGIFEWTGTINDQGGTFKVLFNGGWSHGFRHGTNDYYWEDAQYVTDIGDDDYGVVLVKGTYRLTVDVNKGTLSREIVKGDNDYINITECRNWTSVSLPSVNESNTVFSGNVTFAAEDGFIVVQGDGNRNWVRKVNSPQSALKWNMSERRAKEDGNETYWFFAPESRTYKVTVDVQNDILTLE